VSRGTQSSQSLQSTQKISFSARFLISVSLLVVVAATAGCGKKGPPLPPLVKLPSPPDKLLAERRGNTVDLQFTVPATNTDGTRPANISRAEVYAVTTPPLPARLTDEQLLKLATRVGEVQVKAPRDPNRTADADDPADEVEAPEGPGLDQGAIVRLHEPLTAAALAPVDVSDVDRNEKSTDGDSSTRLGAQPLLPPPRLALTRTYVAYATTTRGRKGPLSPRTEVPLVPPPAPPARPEITYDEKSITLKWPPVAPPRGEAAADPSLLPSTPIGDPQPAIAYNVYDASSATAPIKLTPAPIAESTFVDNRMAWGQKRCYTLRTAETIGSVTIESDAPEPPAGTLVDTFPPAAPQGVQGIPSEGAINLIWQSNPEKDLAGYLVLRGELKADGTQPEKLQPITPEPISETTYRDAKARPGVRYIYAIVAVDKATPRNVSAESNRVEESAR